LAFKQTARALPLVANAHGDRDFSGFTGCSRRFQVEPLERLHRCCLPWPRNQLGRESRRWLVISGIRRALVEADFSRALRPGSARNLRAAADFFRRPTSVCRIQGRPTCCQLSCLEPCLYGAESQRRPTWPQADLRRLGEPAWILSGAAQRLQLLKPGPGLGPGCALLSVRAWDTQRWRERAQTQEQAFSARDPVTRKALGTRSSLKT